MYLLLLSSWPLYLHPIFLSNPSFPMSNPCRSCVLILPSSDLYPQTSSHSHIDSSSPHFHSLSHTYTHMTILSVSLAIILLVSSRLFHHHLPFAPRFQSPVLPFQCPILLRFPSSTHYSCSPICILHVYAFVGRVRVYCCVCECVCVCLYVYLVWKRCTNKGIELEMTVVRSWAMHTLSHAISICIFSTLLFLSNVQFNSSQISDFNSLAELCSLPALSDLYLAGNPISRVQGYRGTIATMLPKLRTLDGKVSLFCHNMFVLMKGVLRCCCLSTVNLSEQCNIPSLATTFHHWQWIPLYLLLWVDYYYGYITIMGHILWYIKCTHNNNLPVIAMCPQ